jgi:tetratricopeptide (TPR) repeat protein
MRAELLLAEGNATQALQIAEEALSIQPKLSYAKRIIAEAHVAQVELEPAVRALTELLQANPRDLAAMVRLAQLELQRRNIPRAAQIAEEAVIEEPDGVTPRIVRAQVNIAKGAFDLASADLTLLNRNVSDIPLVHALMGEIALRRRQFADARRSFDRVTALAPESIEAIRGLTTLEILEGRPQRAVAMIEQRLKRVADDRDLMMLAASVYVLVGNAVKAEQALLQVVSREPNYQGAHVELANLYVEQNRLDVARQRLALVTKGDAAIGAQAMLGMILQQEDKREEAIGVFEKVVAMAPEHAVASNNLAWLYADAGERLNIALQLAQTATRLEPANASFHDTLGWVHLKRGAGDLAVTAFSESVKLDGSDPYYRYHLAMAYAKIGESKKATAELRRALALRPDYKDAQLLLESLPKS